MMTKLAGVIFTVILFTLNVGADGVIDKVPIKKDHAVSITAGKVTVTGHNGAGQCQVPAEAQKDVVKTESGHSHIIALTTGGKVIGWGYSTHGQLDVCKEPGKAIAIAAGHSYSAVLYDDGTVKTSGLPDMSKDLAGLKDVVDITTGGRDLLTLKFKDGKTLTVPVPPVIDLPELPPNPPDPPRQPEEK